MELFISGILLGLIAGVVLAMIFRPKSDDSWLKTQLSDLRAENARLIAAYSAEQQKTKTLTDVRQNMLGEFKNISAQLLESTRKSATQEHTTNLGNAINPFKEQMEKLTLSFNNQIKQMLQDSTASKTAIETQIKTMLDSSVALKKEANDLTEALRGKKKLQGNWGEIQVERLFEILGWTEGLQYDAQQHLSDGRDIPDYIVHMPGDKHFVVDAKMSLNSYMDYLSEKEEVRKNLLWRDFVAATKKHITDLGKKNYSAVVDKKFDYVCMFMPLEHAYIELMNRNKEDIYKFAYDNGVTIATPSLLIPMLRTIDTLMKVEKQSANVAKIVEFAEKLYEKYALFTEDYKKVGAALTNAQNTYDAGLNKLTTGRGNISGWFEKIKKQGGLSVSKNLAIAPENDDEDTDE